LLKRFRLPVLPRVIPRTTYTGTSNFFQPRFAHLGRYGITSRYPLYPSPRYNLSNHSSTSSAKWFANTRCRDIPLSHKEARRVALIGQVEEGHNLTDRTRHTRTMVVSLFTPSIPGLRQ
jgi:hypothetical protein